MQTTPESLQLKLQILAAILRQGMSESDARHTAELAESAIAEFIENFMMTPGDYYSLKRAHIRACIDFMGRIRDLFENNKKEQKALGKKRKIDASIYHGPIVTEPSKGIDPARFRKQNMRDYIAKHNSLQNEISEYYIGYTERGIFFTDVENAICNAHADALCKLREIKTGDTVASDRVIVPSYNGLFVRQFTSENGEFTDLIYNSKTEFGVDMLIVKLTYNLLNKIYETAAEQVAGQEK